MLKHTELTQEHTPSTAHLAVPDTTFEELTALLLPVKGKDKRKVEDRVEAARKLRDFGPAAIAPLCAALRDKEDQIRVAAAESLGVVGDERAVQPLVEALRDVLPGRSAARNRIGRVLFWITMPIVVVIG